MSLKAESKWLVPAHLTAISPGLGYWRRNLSKQFGVALTVKDVSFEQLAWNLKLQGGYILICMLPVTAIPVLVTGDL
jgi:hypothetical protein